MASNGAGSPLFLPLLLVSPAKKTALWPPTAFSSFAGVKGGGRRRATAPRKVRPFSSTAADAGPKAILGSGHNVENFHVFARRRTCNSPCGLGC
ncbi:hypothetical protein J3F83DRAFT_740577 [Trichoderma novae-zelandiae]